MNGFPTTAAAIGLTLCSAVSAGDGPTYELKYRFEAGTAFRYRETVSFETEARSGDFVETNATKSETVKSAVIASVDDAGVATLTLTVEQAKLTPTANGQALPRLDTASDEPVPFAYEAVADAIGRPLAEIRVDAAGGYVDGRPLLGDDVLETLAKGETGGDAVTRNFLIPLPDGPVAVGHRWEQRFKGRISFDGANLKREIDLRRRFELKAVDDGRATIAVRTTVLTPLRDPQALTQVATREPRGEIVFDLDRGVMVSHRVWASGRVFDFAGPGSVFEASSEQALTLLEVADAASAAVATTDE